MFVGAAAIYYFWLCRLKLLFAVSSAINVSKSVIFFRVNRAYNCRLVRATATGIPGNFCPVPDIDNFEG